MNKKIIASLLMTAICFTTTGCNSTSVEDLAKPFSEAEQSNENTKTNETDGEEALAHKKDVYITFYNALMNEMDNAMNEYFEKVYCQDEYQSVKESGFDLLNVSFYKCKENYEELCELADQKPKLPIDESFKTFKPTYEKMAGILDKIGKETIVSSGEDGMQKNYEKDVANHKELMAIYDEYLQASSDFYEAIDVLCEGRDDELLADLKERGEMSYYYLLESVIDTQAFLAEIDATCYCEDEDGWWYDYSLMDDNKMNSICETLEGHIDEFNASYKEDAKESGDYVKKARFFEGTVYEERVHDLEQLSTYARSIVENKEDDEKAEEQYNNLVNASNDVNEIYNNNEL